MVDPIVPAVKRTLLLMAVFGCIALGYGACALVGWRPSAYEALGWRQMPLILLAGLVLLAAESGTEWISERDRPTDPLAMRVLRLAVMLIVAGIGFGLLYFIAIRM
jgi:hypothetical protein